MRTICLATLFLITSLGTVARADVASKVSRIRAATAQSETAWRSTRAALRSLKGNKPLRAALGARSEALVLGERSGAYTRSSAAYSKALHLGLSTFTGYMPVKVKWKEQLVLGPKGLEVRRLQSVSKPTSKSVTAFQANLDAQFAKKPSTIKMPDTKVEFAPFTGYQQVKSTKARLGLLGWGSKRLKPEVWGHVTASKIEAATKAWGNTP